LGGEVFAVLEADDKTILLQFIILSFFCILAPYLN